MRRLGEVGCRMLGVRRSKMWGRMSIVLIICCSSLALGDGPPVQWHKTFGGSDFYDVGSVQQTMDGGYVIAGTIEPLGLFPDEDMYLIKTDSEGKLKWQRTFGGSDYDSGLSVQQTSDGGFIVAGSTSSFGLEKSDIYLVKTDPNGNAQWQQTFGGSDQEYGCSVQQTIDGGYIVSGYTQTPGISDIDVYLVKTDPNGNSEWEETFGGEDYDWGYSVQQTVDGGYIVTGHTWSFSDSYLYDVYLIKTDPNGNSEWEKTFGKPSGGWSVQQTLDGGYIIAGFVQTEDYPPPPFAKTDAYLIKVDCNGNLQWEKSFGGVESDWSRSVQQTADGGYIIAGGTESFGAGQNDAYIIKTDPNGNSQWQKTFGGSDYERCYSLRQTADGGYIIACSTNSFGSGDLYLIKLCSDGTLSGDLNCDGTVNFKDLQISANQWLQPRSILYPPADICGVGDGITNFLDLCIVAEEWMREE